MNSLRLKRAKQKSGSEPPVWKYFRASRISSGRGGRDKAKRHAESIWQRRFAPQILSSRSENDCETSCMNPELNNERAWSACVDTGRTGHDVMASGWSKAVSMGRRTLRLLYR